MDTTRDTLALAPHDMPQGNSQQLQQQQPSDPCMFYMSEMFWTLCIENGLIVGVLGGPHGSPPFKDSIGKAAEPMQGCLFTEAWL